MWNKFKERGRKINWFQEINQMKQRLFSLLWINDGRSQQRSSNEEKQGDLLLLKIFRQVSFAVYFDCCDLTQKVIIDFLTIFKIVLVMNFFPDFTI